MFESYIRGVFYYNYSSCHQLHTVALSFLPYAAGKQQLEGKMPKIGHFHFTNRSPRDNLLSGELTIKKFRNPEKSRFFGGFFMFSGIKTMFIQPRKRSVFGVFQFSKRVKTHTGKKVPGPQKKKNFCVRLIIFGTIIGQCTTWGNEGTRKQE